MEQLIKVLCIVVFHKICLHISILKSIFTWQFNIVIKQRADLNRNNYCWFYQCYLVHLCLLCFLKVPNNLWYRIKPKITKLYWNLKKVVHFTLNYLTVIHYTGISFEIVVKEFVLLKSPATTVFHSNLFKWLVLFTWILLFLNAN